jgi:hypothetical protein
MSRLSFPKFRGPVLAIAWIVVGLTVAGSALPSRAATQVPLELRNVPDEKKPRLMEERTWRLQREQAAAAIQADRHQKAFRQSVMTGVTARAQQRAAEISGQLGSAEAITQQAGSSSGVLLAGATLLFASLFLFIRWRRRARAG